MSKIDRSASRGEIVFSVGFAAEHVVFKFYPPESFQNISCLSDYIFPTATKFQLFLENLLHLSTFRLRTYVMTSLPGKSIS